MRTIRRPFMALAIGTAALALALSGCSGGETDEDAASPTESVATEPAPSGSGPSEEAVTP